MFKPLLTVTLIITALSFSALSQAEPTLEQSQECSVKNLQVVAEKGDNVQMDVVRTHDSRGDIFIKLNTKEAIGDHLLLSINDGKPAILKIEKSKSPAQSANKGAFIPRAIISKLRSAQSVKFQISMLKRAPIHGQLGQSHFEWLKRFGMACG